MTDKPKNWCRNDPAITHAELRSLLDYDQHTGELRWRVRRGGTRPGMVAGWRQSKGYIGISLNSHKTYAHRVAWFWMTGQWPRDQIDHADGNKANNAWANLREATNRQNQQNQPVSRASSTGLKGAYRVSASAVAKGFKPFIAQITVNGRRVHLGHFDTPEQANAAYRRAADQYHGIFARA